MTILNVIIGEAATATSTSYWHGALGALASTGLPVFGIILWGQRATAAFYRGWRPGGGASATRRFRISKMWRMAFLTFSFGLIALSVSLLFDERVIPGLLLFMAVPCLGSAFVVYFIFRSSIDVTPEEIIYRFGIKTYRTKMTAIKRAYAASFLLVLELKEGGAIPLPLICLENVSELASCLYEKLHKS